MKKRKTLHSIKSSSPVSFNNGRGGVGVGGCPPHLTHPRGLDELQTSSGTAP